jgi:hypothetical protein
VDFPPYRRLSLLITLWTLLNFDVAAFALNGQSHKTG